MRREAEKHLKEASMAHYLFIFSVLQPRQASLPPWPPIESSIELRLVVGYIKRSHGNGDLPLCNVHVSTWYIIYSTGLHTCNPAADSCRQGQIVWSNMSFCCSQYCTTSLVQGFEIHHQWVSVMLQFGGWMCVM